MTKRDVLKLKKQGEEMLAAVLERKGVAIESGTPYSLDWRIKQITDALKKLDAEIDDVNSGKVQCGTHDSNTTS